MKKLLILIAVLSLCFGEEVNKTGTTAAKFLSIGPGSRAIAMGGAYSSMVDDATAMYWNPAGLARLKNIEIFINHTNWIADIYYDYIGLVIPMRHLGNFGVNLTYVSIGEMDVTMQSSDDEFTGETFNSRQFALAVSYGLNLTDRFSIGFNGKYISEGIWNSKARGAAIDVGTLFDTPFGFRLGASIANFGPKMKMSGVDLTVLADAYPEIEGNNGQINALLDTDSFDLPMILRVGVSDDVTFGSSRLTWSVDANSPNDNTNYLNAGFELGLLNEMVFFRGGSKAIGMNDREEEHTLGGGIQYPMTYGGKFCVDYAYESMVHLGNIHKFSLRLYF